MTDLRPGSQLLSRPSAAARPVLTWLPGFLFAGTVIAGAILTVASPATRTRPHEQPVLTGQWAQAYEHTLDAGIAFRSTAVSLWANVNYTLFREARDGALVGRNGWLYTTEEFQTAPADAQERTRKLRYILQVRNLLGAQGTRLIIALIPAKSRIYADQLGGQRVPAQLASQYSDFLGRLRQAGVSAPDLLKTFGKARQQGSAPLFLRTDTHWSPVGAALAAQQIAKMIRADQPDLPAAQFLTTLSPAHARAGDLLHYLPVAAHTGPALDMTGTSSTEHTGGSGGGLLLNTATLPSVTLVGTSYSARTKDNIWNFDGQLQQALGSDVMNAAQEGKGPITPMAAYLMSSARKTAPPQVVVWEIPERYLRVEYPEETAATP